jgi:fido (protein-threonine AMPylation protein)
MSDKSFNLRQVQILENAILGHSYPMLELAVFVDEFSPSAATLKRDMAQLCKMGFFEKLGANKNARYRLTAIGALFAPLNAKKYCAKDPDLRPAQKSYVFDYFSNMPSNFFSADELAKLQLATQKFITKSEGQSEGLRIKELERFIIEFAWKSSKIEGNTYSLLDTERLIRDGIEASGHSSEEKSMILNHKLALQYAMEKKGEYMNIDLRKMAVLHQFIVKDLAIADGIRSRMVGITGCVYKPLSIKTQIEEALMQLCATINRAENPYTKALLALAGISYIQPFEDGNKRTARLLSNAILLHHDCASLSFRSTDEADYKEATLVFYEKNCISPLKKIFLEQYFFACENYLKSF